eukprot:scaffold486_cov254-Pinguiococcus_pyrenoidosus.AAC.4
MDMASSNLAIASSRPSPWRDAGSAVATDQYRSLAASSSSSPIREVQPSKMLGRLISGKETREVRIRSVATRAAFATRLVKLIQRPGLSAHKTLA